MGTVAVPLHLPPALELHAPPCLNSLQFHTTLDCVSQPVPVKNMIKKMFKKMVGWTISQLWALFFMVSNSSQALNRKEDSELTNSLVHQPRLSSNKDQASHQHWTPVKLVCSLFCNHIRHMASHELVSKRKDTAKRWHYDRLSLLFILDNKSIVESTLTMWDCSSYNSFSKSSERKHKMKGRLLSPPLGASSPVKKTARWGRK